MVTALTLALRASTRSMAASRSSLGVTLPLPNQLGQPERVVGFVVRESTHGVVFSSVR